MRQKIIIKFKKLFSFFMFIILSFYLCSCNLNKTIIDVKKEEILKINFDEYYENDRVDFYLNDQQLLKDEILSNSKLYSGPTKIFFTVYKKQKLFYVEKSGKGDLTIIKKITNKVKFKLVFNGEEQIFKFDLKEGRWFSVYKSKKEGARPIIEQSPYKMWFD